MGFSITDVLSDTLLVLRQRFGVLLGMWATYLGISIAAVFLVMLVVGVGAVSGAALGAGDNLGAGALGALGAGFIVTMIVFYIGYIALFYAQAASLCALSSQGRQPAFGEAFVAGLRAVPGLLAATLLLLLGYGILAVPFSLLVRAGGGTGTLAGLLPLVILPLLAWLGCRLSLLVPVAAIEQVRGPIRLIQRSWTMTRGHALKIFGAFVAYMLALAALGALVLLPVMGSLDGGQPPGGFAILWLFGGMMVVFVLLSLAQSALIAAIHARLGGSEETGLAEAFA